VTELSFPITFTQGSLVCKIQVV